MQKELEVIKKAIKYVDWTKFELVQLNKSEFAIVYKEDYLKFQDAGVSGNKRRIPGTSFKFSNKMPPVSAIVDWAKKNNIANSDKIESVSFAIAKSIQTRGFKGKDYIPDSKLEKDVDNVTEALADLKMQEIEKELDKIL